MYLSYWGFNKHPFHNVPDPKIYFQKSKSSESPIHEVYFAIKDGDECLAVIIGEAGLGKTLILRLLFNTLDENKYSLVLVNNPVLTFQQLLSEIITQLSGDICNIQEKEKLLKKFREILLENNRNKKKVVILIDEGSVLSKENLEGLRLLTNLQGDDKNLLTIILAGQPQLANVLEHPDMSNLFQRIGVYCKLKKLESREVLKEYIQFRLLQAGCRNNIFTEEAIDSIWNYSENGVPRLVNRLCKLALNAGANKQLRNIDMHLIDAIGIRFAGIAGTNSTNSKSSNQGKMETGKGSSNYTKVDNELRKAKSYNDKQSVTPNIMERHITFIEPGKQSLNSNQIFDIFPKRTQHPMRIQSISAPENKTEKTESAKIQIHTVDQTKGIESINQTENKPKQRLIHQEQDKTEINPRTKSISEAILSEIKTSRENDNKVRLNKTGTITGKWEGTKVFTEEKPTIVSPPLEKPVETELSFLQKPKSPKNEIDLMEEERNKEIINRMRDRHSRRVGGFSR